MIPDELRTFSAQSWALVHLLMLGYDDVVAGQQALDRYWALVLQGTDSVAAFEQSIGEVDEFDRELRGYIRQVSFKQFRGRDKPRHRCRCLHPPRAVTD